MQRVCERVLRMMRPPCAGNQRQMWCLSPDPPIAAVRWPQVVRVRPCLYRVRSDLIATTYVYRNDADFCSDVQCLRSNLDDF